MNFTSFIFLFLFFPLTLACYLAVPKNYKNPVLLFASLIFFAWGSPTGAMVLCLTSYSDYFITRKFEQHPRKSWITAGVIINLLFLGYFKYANFFVEQVSSAFGMNPDSWVKVLLPAGISFFTFEKISYLIDVYKKEVPAAKSFADYLLFTSLFPHLIAGPILKYRDLAGQIQSRSSQFNDLTCGMIRFITGLAKKVLIADEMGVTADVIFNGSYAQPTSLYTAIGIVAYSMQIYFDFSGYSDMAIGLARLFGFRFSENFNHPYTAASITDFWKRWHISLTQWMREYLYIPLGGNRHGTFVTYRNLCLVFFLSGLWHGAKWTYVVWGIYHGALLVAERIFLQKQLERLPKVISTAITFSLVSLGWIIFRSPDFKTAKEVLEKLVSLNPGKSVMYPEMLIDARGALVFCIALLLAFVAPHLNTKMLKEKTAESCPASLLTGSKILACMILFVLSCSALSAQNYTSFLYFQF